MELFCYNRQFPTSNLTEDEATYTTVINTPALTNPHLDNDYSTLSSFGYHHGEPHHFKLTGLLLEKGVISHETYSQVTRFENNTVDTVSRKSSQESYQLGNQTLDEEQADYLRALLYTTHYGGEQFLIDSEYSVNTSSEGAAVGRLTDYSLTLIAQDNTTSINTYSGQVSIDCKGYDTIETATNNDELVGTLINLDFFCIGLGFLQYNKDYPMGSPIILQYNTDSSTTEFCFWDKLRERKTAPLKAIPTTSINYFYIKDTPHHILAMSTMGRYILWNTATQNITSGNLNLTITSVVSFDESFYITDSLGRVSVLYESSDNSAVLFIPPDSPNDANILVVDDLSNTIYCINDTGRLYCSSDGIEWLLLEGRLYKDGIKAALITKGMIFFYSPSLGELGKVNIDDFEYENSPVLIPEDLSVSYFSLTYARGGIIITKNTSNHSPTYYKIDTVVGGKLMAINTTIKAYQVVFSQESWWCFSPPNNNVVRISPKLFTPNRTSAITNGVLWHNGINWEGSWDYDTNLDIVPLSTKFLPDTAAYSLGANCPVHTQFNDSLLVDTVIHSVIENKFNADLTTNGLYCVFTQTASPSIIRIGELTLNNTNIPVLTEITSYAMQNYLVTINYWLQIVITPNHFVVYDVNSSQNPNLATSFIECAIVDTTSYTSYPVNNIRTLLSSTTIPIATGLLPSKQNGELVSSFFDSDYIYLCPFNYTVHPAIPFAVKIRLNATAAASTFNTLPININWNTAGNFQYSSTSVNNSTFFSPTEIRIYTNILNATALLGSITKTPDEIYNLLTVSAEGDRLYYLVYNTSNFSTRLRCYTFPSLVFRYEQQYLPFINTTYFPSIKGVNSTFPTFGVTGSISQKGNEPYCIGSNEYSTSHDNSRNTILLGRVGLANYLVLYNDEVLTNTKITAFNLSSYSEDNPYGPPFDTEQAYLNQITFDTSFSPDAIIHTADFEPDNTKFRVSSFVLPPAQISSGFLADYPCLFFSMDRRYNGQEDLLKKGLLRWIYTLRGTFSDVTLGEYGKKEIDLPDKNLVEVSVVSEKAALQRIFEVKTQATCRWKFGSKPCGRIPVSFQAVVTVPTTVGYDESKAFYCIAIEADYNSNLFPLLVQFPNLLDVTYLTYGIVEILSGQNAGYRMTIRASKEEIADQLLILELLYATPYPMTTGDTIRITQGCNKTLDRCKIYQQQINFGGFPYVTGNGVFVRGTNFTEPA